jgi:hypothetical protein
MEAIKMWVSRFEELTRQASDLSAAVVEIIPRAIAEAEAEARPGGATDAEPGAADSRAGTPAEAESV